MDEELLVPQMTKKGKKKFRNIKVSKFNLILVFVGVLLLVFSTFIAIPFKHFIIPNEIFSNKNLNFNDYVFTFLIIPQIPFLFLIYSLFRKKLTLGIIYIYMLLGLTIFPIFALGGGFNYFAQYGFGYILAYVPAIILIDRIYSENESILASLKSAILGGVFIHLCGIFYMLILAMFKHTGIDFVKNWIIYQSSLKMVYDIVLSFIFMLIGKPIYYSLSFLNEK